MSSSTNEATELAKPLTNLHLALEMAVDKDSDWGLARYLEDRLGTGQHNDDDIEGGQRLPKYQHD